MASNGQCWQLILCCQFAVQLMCCERYFFFFNAFLTDIVNVGDEDMSLEEINLSLHWLIGTTY